jgi:hypothetical protein
MSRRAAWTIAAYALLAVIVIPVYPHFNSPNEFTRWATAAALTEYHSFEVARFAPLLGRDFEDLSVVNGKYYSNKAPGGAMVGLPAYAAARMLTGPPSPETMRPTLTAMRLLAATLPAILLAIVFAGVARRLGGDDVAPAVATLLFATPLFAYGLVNFSHALAAMSLFAAWALLFVQPSRAGDYAAGALIGLATVSEYPSAIAGAAIVAFAIGSRNIVRIVAGGLPFAIALALYNRALFGSYFALSSGFERDPAYNALAKRGLFGISVPDPIVALRLLFDPSKGLFLFSPVLVLALLAIPRVRAAVTPRQFWSLVAVPAAVFLTYAGYPNWHGGWTVGPRYLVPALPFLALPLAFLGDRLKVAFAILFGSSVAAIAVTTLVFPFVPPDIPVPWGTFALPILRNGLIAPNLLHAIARPAAIVVPFLIVAAAAALAVDRRRLAGVAAGAAIAVAAGMLVPVPPALAVVRGFVEEVSFEQPGAIARSTPAGMHVSESLVRRAAAAKQQPPTSWPF